MKDGKKILTTPISAEDLKDIHIGDNERKEKAVKEICKHVGFIK